MKVACSTVRTDTDEDDPGSGIACAFKRAQRAAPGGHMHAGGGMVSHLDFERLLVGVGGSVGGANVGGLRG